MMFATPSTRGISETYRNSYEIQSGWSRILQHELSFMMCFTQMNFTKPAKPWGPTQLTPVFFDHDTHETYYFCHTQLPILIQRSVPPMGWDWNVMQDLRRNHDVMTHMTSKIPYIHYHVKASSVPLMNLEQKSGLLLLILHLRLKVHCFRLCFSP